MWLISLKKVLKSDGCYVSLYCPILIGWQKKCDLEQKMVRFVNKSHRWEPLTLQG